jgi:hypothetical protein
MSKLIIVLAIEDNEILQKALEHSPKFYYFDMVIAKIRNMQAQIRPGKNVTYHH